MSKSQEITIETKASRTNCVPYTQPEAQVETNTSRKKYRFTNFS